MVLRHAEETISQPNDLNDVINYLTRMATAGMGGQ